MDALPIGVLASGSGTNFEAIAQAIDDGTLRARIALLVCNRPRATVLEKARHRGLATAVIDHSDFDDRASFDEAVADALEGAGVQLVVMAGFDRIVTRTLLRRFPMRILNIHPALLPAFRGSHAQRQASEYGVTIAGATVHFVDEDVDHGPILIQGAVAIEADDSEEDIRLRILGVEHRIYPEAIRLYAEGRVDVRGRKVHLRGASLRDDHVLVSPRTRST